MAETKNKIITAESLKAAYDDLKAKINQTPSGGTSDLPSVTTENNGAFLRVVDGIWAASKIANAEEAEF